MAVPDRSCRTVLYAVVHTRIPTLYTDDGVVHALSVRMRQMHIVLDEPNPQRTVGLYMDSLVLSLGTDNVRSIGLDAHIQRKALTITGAASGTDVERINLYKQKINDMMIRNANRNISVAKGHGYTFEKVKFAKDFVEKSGRNTTIQDWVDAYNYIKDANETAQGCQACKAAKFTAAVRNYARYGYMTLLNEGYKPEDFRDNGNIVETSNVEETTENGFEPEKQSETVVDEPDAILAERPASETVEPASETASEPEVVSTVTETADEGEPTVELPQPAKPKRVKKSKKNDKSDNK